MMATTKLNGIDAPEDQHAADDEGQRHTPEQDVMVALAFAFPRPIDRVDDEDRAVGGGDEIGHQQKDDEARHDCGDSRIE